MINLAHEREWYSPLTHAERLRELRIAKRLALTGLLSSANHDVEDDVPVATAKCAVPVGEIRTPPDRSSRRDAHLRSTLANANEWSRPRPGRKAPTFCIGTAPTSPGMPARHSTPGSPFSTVQATNSSQISPAAAVTSVRPSRAPTRSMPRVAIRNTTPPHPSSAMKRDCCRRRRRAVAPWPDRRRGRSSITSDSVSASTRRRAEAAELQRREMTKAETFSTTRTRAD